MIGNHEPLAWAIGSGFNRLQLGEIDYAQLISELRLSSLIGAVEEKVDSLNKLRR